MNTSPILLAFTRSTMAAGQFVHCALEVQGDSPQIQARANRVVAPHHLHELVVVYLAVVVLRTVPLHHRRAVSIRWSPAVNLCYAD